MNGKQPQHRLFVVGLMLLLLLASTSTHVSSLKIPKDVEILDGYEFDDSAEYYPTVATSNEALSLLSGLQKSIRNKRSSMAYDLAKESLAASASASESPPTGKQEQKRSTAGGSAGSRAEQSSVSSQHIEVSDAQQRMDRGRAAEHLPRAEQQVMDPDFDYYSQRRIATWSEAPASGANDDGDVDAKPEATNNFMSRSRQPRVNFVTQPRSDSGPVKDLPDPVVVAKIPLLNGGFYEAKYGLDVPSYSYDMYPSRSYDPYLRRYDRFDEQHPRFDPYSFEDKYVYRRHYDPYDSYSPRTPQYPEPYYNYPDRHYDIPEPREYTASLYNNEVYGKAGYPEGKLSPIYSPKFPNFLSTPPKYPNYPLNPAKYPYHSSHPLTSKYPDQRPHQRRYIYYAHLPEIVRTPYDFPFHSNRGRYDAAFTANKANFNPDKAHVDPQSGSGSVATGSGLSGGGAKSAADHSYEYTKRDKKDYVTAKPNKLNAASRQ